MWLGRFLGPVRRASDRSAPTTARPRISRRRDPGLRPQAGACDRSARALCRDCSPRPARPGCRARRWRSGGCVTPTSCSPESMDRPADVAVGNPPYIRYDDLPDDGRRRVPADVADDARAGETSTSASSSAVSDAQARGKVGFICADRWMRNQYGAGLRSWSPAATRSSTSGRCTTWMPSRLRCPPTRRSPCSPTSPRRRRSWLTPPPSSERQRARAREGRQDEALIEFTDAGVQGAPAAALVRRRRIVADRVACASRPDRAPQRPVRPPARPGRPGPRCPSASRRARTRSTSPRTRTWPSPTDAAPVDAPGPDVGHVRWQGNYLVNPWADDGSLVSLADYPRMAAYLAEHPGLRSGSSRRRRPGPGTGRSTRCTPSSLGRPKLLLQDMKAHIHPVLEPAATTRTTTCTTSSPTPGTWRCSAGFCCRGSRRHSSRRIACGCAAERSASRPSISSRSECRTRPIPLTSEAP